MRLLVLLGCLLGATTVRAGNGEFHGTANGSVATTDNENGAATGSPGRKAGFFTDVRPGVLYTYSSRRMIHELVADVDLLYRFGNDKPAVTSRADWKAFMLPSPLTDLSLGASVQAGQVNTLSASTLPGDIPLQVVPLGHVNVLQAAASENFSWIASEATRVWQRAFSRFTTTDDSIAFVDTESFEAGVAVGFERHLRRDAFAFEVGGSFVHLKRIEDPTMPRFGNRLDRQLNPRGVVMWQHDYNKFWSWNVDVGAVYVNPIWTDPFNPTDVRKAAAFPIVGAIGAYTEVWGRAQFDVRRQVTPNLMIAQNTLSDSVRVAMAMPLRIHREDSKESEPRVIGLGSLGFERVQLINPLTSSLDGAFNVVRIDVGVGWQPRPGQTLGLRYEFTYQTGDTVAAMVAPSFFRNTFYFTFALRYPEDIQVRVPRRTQSVRADRGDLAPIGAEPIIVDPAEELLEDRR